MKKKIFTALLVLTLSASMLTACSSNNSTENVQEKATESQEPVSEDLVTLKSSSIVVNADGSFAIEGTMKSVGTTLKIGTVILTPTMTGNEFITYVQMGDPVDSTVLTATYILESQDIPISLDTSQYVAALDQAKAAEQKKVDETNTLNNLVNTPLIDAKTKIEELGYTASYFYETSGLDCTGEITAGIEELNSRFIVTQISSIDTENHTVKVALNTQENIDAAAQAAAMEAALSDKLAAITAWQAADAYGESMYPYGFKLHYLIGKLAEDAEDENTWFLKASCSVTNEYNATAELTCEAHVTGTNDNPQVVDFIVY